MKKIISLLLAFCFIFAVAAGCSKEPAKPDDNTTAGSGGDSTTAPVEKPWYDGLNYDGMDMLIACRGQSYSEYVIGNENSGDVAWDAVYDTNERINGTLKINREFALGSNDASEFINTAIKESTNDGIYEMIMCDQYYGTAFAAQNAYQDVNELSCEKSYLDLSKPCWYQDYNDNITIGAKKLFFLGGDISPTILAWAACTFMNWNLYEDVFGEPEEILDAVEAGQWDIDMLREKDIAVYLDLNQNDKVDLDDRIGSATSAGQSAAFAAISAGMTFSKKNAEGLYDLTIDTDFNNSIFEKVFELYRETQGFITYDFGANSNGNINTFSDGRMLFMNEYFLYAFRDGCREMEDDYVIIPRPKFDENQPNYLSALQDSLYIYTIPTTADLNKHEAISAYLQLGCEFFSEYVITAMYDTALKVKNVSDKVDMDRAGKIIDLVRAGITSDFAVVYQSTIGGMANMVGALITSGRKDWHGGVALQKKMYEGYLNDLLKKFY